MILYRKRVIQEYVLGDEYMEEISDLKKKVAHLEYDEIKNIKDEIGNIKVNLAENNLLTKQCVDSNEKLNDTMNSVKDTMIIMSESMKQSNKVSEELTLSVKSLGTKVDIMDDKFGSKFQEVDNKINGVNDKSKIDILDWLKNNWFGVVAGVGVIIYISTQIIK